MWKILMIILMFFVWSSSSYFVKHSNKTYWWTDEHPNRPCRDDEGWTSCYRHQRQYCQERYFGCDDVDLTRCNDDEFLYKFSDGNISCIARYELRETFPFVVYFPCHADEYECKFIGKCIPREWVQDGKDDCSLFDDNWKLKRYVDDSDEVNVLQNCFNETEYQCNGNKTMCIPRHLVMNGVDDCPEKDDENISLKCFNQTEFKCAENGQCIPRKYINDGFSDCPNNSDENIKSFTCNDRFEFSCDNTNDYNQCIPREWVGNGVDDCRNGQDENATISECYEGEFSCVDKKRCLPFKYRCDGIQNCVDGSDEVELCSNPTMYRYNKTKPLVPWHLVLFDGKKTIQRNYPQFTRQHDLLFGFKCTTLDIDFITNIRIPSVHLHTVPQVYILNNLSICYNDEDKCFHEDKFQCARCLDGTIISKSQVCDNIIDCRDLSDECTCEQSQVEKLCEEVLSSNSKSQIIFETICDGNRDMKNGLDESFCKDEVLLNKREIPDHKNKVNRTKFKCSYQHVGNSSTVSNPDNVSFCDGHIDCPFWEDECSSECFKKDFNIETLAKCFPFLELSKDNHLLFKLSITENNIAQLYSFSGDKQADCVYYIDPKIPEQIREHENSTHKNCWKYKSRYYTDFNYLCDIFGVNCPWMHNCKTNISKKVEILKRCDYKDDCGDNSDEMNCSDETHFYCNSKSPLFIPTSKVADGRSDCSDRSDECKETAFSSAKEMLKNIFFKVFVWICAVFVIIMNILVLIKHFRKISAIPSKSTVAYCNTYLLINLAFSDMIFGFTLLTIGIKSQQFSGNYCQFDLEWRSSLPCNLIGIFTVISSQTSMNLLVLMTGLRAYITFRPYMTNSLNINRLVFASFLCWGVSIFLASFPIWGNTNFINFFHIKQNLYLKDQIISRTHLESYVENTKTIALLTNFSEAVTVGTNGYFITDILNNWFFNTKNSSATFPTRHVHVKSNFGFYSSSSVCFPNLFAQFSTASQYSLFIVLYNLFCLVFIAIGYCFIFYRARKSKAKVQTDNEKRVNRQNNKMMKRIFFIVATDMLCWVPIIAMSVHSYRGYKLPEFVHPLSAIVFLPINSLINPMIYANLHKTIKRLFIKFCCPSETPAAPVERIQMNIVRRQPVERA